jgi:putative addiction module CopG family antidote
MEILLSLEKAEFVRKQVESGRYRSADEVIADGLGYVEWKAPAREEIEVGADQLERGKVADGDEAFRKLSEKSKAWRTKSA